MDLSHPNIVFLSDAFYRGDAAILILEYCPRGTLKDEVLATGGRAWTCRGSASLRVSCWSTCFLPLTGAAHCDAKPSSLLVDEYGLPKLTDSGTAERLSRERSARGQPRVCSA